MRAVLSLWSAPRPMTLDHRVCLALAIDMAREWYQDVQLVTDTPGARLADRMGLGVEVRTDLDDLKVSPRAWAAGKLKAYALQDQPFIHLDSDVFLFKRPFLGRPAPAVFAQSFEGVEFYRGAMAGASPELVALSTLPTGSWGAYNTGIVGGSDVEFLSEYGNRALELVREYPPTRPSQMILYEQSLLAKHARERQRTVEVLLEDIEDAESLGYCHLMCAKSQPECVHRVRARLLSRNPDLHQRALFS